jgi:hypothetical protein
MGGVWQSVPKTLTTSHLFTDISVLLFTNPRFTDISVFSRKVPSMIQENYFTDEMVFLPGGMVLEPGTQLQLNQAGFDSSFKVCFRLTVGNITFPITRNLARKLLTGKLYGVKASKSQYASSFQ